MDRQRIESGLGAYRNHWKSLGLGLLILLCPSCDGVLPSNQPVIDAALDSARPAIHTVDLTSFQVPAEAATHETTATDSEERVVSPVKRASFDLHHREHRPPLQPLDPHEALRIDKQSVPKLNEPLLTAQLISGPQRGVVQVASFLPGGIFLKAGTAILLSENGLLLTAAHVGRITDRSCANLDPNANRATFFVVLISESLDVPPSPRFIATLVAEDLAIDSVLLRITRHVGPEIEDLRSLRQLVDDHGLEALSGDPVNASDLRRTRLEPLPSWTSSPASGGRSVLGIGYPGLQRYGATPMLGSFQAQIIELSDPLPAHLFRVERLLAWSGSSGGALLDHDSGYLFGMICGGRVDTQLARAVRIDDIFASESLAPELSDFNRPPIASFQANPVHPALSEPIAFDASSVKDPDGQLVRYEWDLDDNGTFEAEGRRISYQFTEAELERDEHGVLRDPNVHLRVTDTDGAQHTIRKRLMLKRDTSCQVQLQQSDETLFGFTTIQEAIEAIKGTETTGVTTARATITVSGRCQERVRIEGLQHLTLKGEAETRPILFGLGDSPAILIHDSRAIAVEGLTIRSGLQGIKVAEHSSDIHVIGNVLQDNLAAGMVIENSEGVKVKNNLVLSNGGEGLDIFVELPQDDDITHVVIENNRIAENQTGGIVIRGGAITQPAITPIVYVQMDNNIIVKNTDVGIALRRLTDARISKATISGTIASQLIGDGLFGMGLQVAGNSIAVVLESAISDNAEEGLTATATSARTDDFTLAIERTTVSGNRDNGVELSASASLSLSESTVSRNTADGIEMRGGARASLLNSSVSENGLTGLELRNSAQADLTSSSVLGNRFDGIRLLWDDVQISLVDSTVSQNDGGLYTWHNASISMVQSVISENADYGLQLNGSELRLKDSQIIGNCKENREGPCYGLRVVGSAHAILVDSFFEDHPSCAIEASIGSLVFGWGNHFSGNNPAVCGTDARRLSRNLPDEPNSRSRVSVPQDAPTLQSAIDLASGGASIIVSAGFYDETIEILDKSLQIMTNGNGNVHVSSVNRGSGVVIFSSTPGRTEIKGLQIGPFSEEGIAVGGLAEVRLERVSVLGNADNGVMTRDNALVTLYKTSIRQNCNLSRGLIAMRGIYPSCGGLKLRDNSRLNLMTSSVTDNCRLHGEPIIDIRYPIACGGLWIGDSAQAIIQGNEISGNDIGWGILIPYSPCIPTSGEFTGKVSGKANTILDNGRYLADSQKKTGDDKGDVCPEVLKFLQDPEGGQYP